jgi:hypothetical protein
MEAMSQALDDKNFKILYEIISKALDEGDKALTQQAHEVRITFDSISC